MKTQLNKISLCFLLCLPTMTMAEIIKWQNPSPSALKPFNNSAKTVADLAGNQILLYSHPSQNIQFQTKKGLKSYNNVQFTTGALVVNATPQQIQTALQDYQKYVGLFPTLKTAKILEQQGNTKQVKYKVSIQLKCLTLTKMRLSNMKLKPMQCHH